MGGESRAVSDSFRWVAHETGRRYSDRERRCPKRCKGAYHRQRISRESVLGDVFPEGTRTRDGRVIRFTDGAFRLAIKTQVPILPLALDGTSNALRKHDWRFGRADHIHLKVLPPVSTEGLTAADTEALRNQVRSMIIGQLAEWRNEAPELVDSYASSPVHEEPHTAGGETGSRSEKP